MKICKIFVSACFFRTQLHPCSYGVDARQYGWESKAILSISTISRWRMSDRPTDLFITLSKIRSGFKQLIDDFVVFALCMNSDVPNRKYRCKPKPKPNRV